MRAYVANEDDGTLTVIDLNALTVAGTITLRTSLRPEAIAPAPPGFLFITIPSAGPTGEVILLTRFRHTDHGSGQPGPFGRRERRGVVR